eukprot:Skav213974  [mRNA]  locus=scaffold2200:265560:270087:+ [translate_table: standard]
MGRKEVEEEKKQEVSQWKGKPISRRSEQWEAKSTGIPRGEPAYLPHRKAELELEEEPPSDEMPKWSGELKKKWKHLNEPAVLTLDESDEDPEGAATPLGHSVDEGPTLQEREPTPEKTESNLGLAAAVGYKPQLLGLPFHPTHEGVAPPGWDFSSPAPSRRDKQQNLSDSGLGRANLGEKRVTSHSGYRNFMDVVRWLKGRLESNLGRLCKVKPTGRVFPLPTALLLLSQCFPEEKEDTLLMLRVVCCSPNSLNGKGVFGTGQVNATQLKILNELRDDCNRVHSWDQRVPLVQWGEFFQVRGVDYKGEEILTARSMQWENVEPALPEEVGAIPLEKVCELGCRHFVENFTDYLVQDESLPPVKPSKVMVPPDQWETFCEKLLARGIFSKIHEDDIHKVGDRPVLNGLFGVSKHEFSGNFEVMRIIMNLVPANTVIRSIDGDVATLPGWSGMTPLELMPDEDLVVSSEDVRCFFYIFKIPQSWHSVMAFNRPLPPRLAGNRPGRWYPCSAVLPMGFKNSVAIAQHVHHFIAKQAVQRAGLGSENELRKDRSFSTANPLYRIYLDNFDALQRVSKKVSEAIQGKVSPLIVGLREEYANLGVPRHPKKSVSNSLLAEVQGAVLDGKAGIAYPKPEKLLKYAHLTWHLLQQRQATQKQVQVVGGGLVYFCMFRRPLLGALNAIWQFITSFEGFPPFIKFSIPREVKEELARFLGLIPLAFMDFRLNVSGQVTASDASESGGGVTVSSRLTPAGHVACNCPVRGDIVEPSDVTQVLTIGLFDGIGALRTAADVLGWNVQGHVSVEMQPEAHRVVEAHFPQLIKVSDVKLVDEEMVRSWAQKFSSVGLVVVGAGPPCQGVSGLNASRKGALKDQRSCLFTHVDRIRQLVTKWMPWAQVRSLMESVASMDKHDQETMSESFGSYPYAIDAGGVSLAHRPRLYWVDWELVSGVGAQVQVYREGPSKVLLQAVLEEKDYLEPGWSRSGNNCLPTFTTARPRSAPGYKPAGLHQCQEYEQRRWRDDAFRFPPYQYKDSNCLRDKHGSFRLPSISEREVIMGFPKDYTMACLPKNRQGSQDHLDLRLSLIGNSWNVTVDAKHQFFSYLDQQKLVLPVTALGMDTVVSDYLEHLWATGAGRSAGSNILAALQDSQPHLKGKLQQSWRLLKTWTTTEVPNRAPPFPKEVVEAMAGYALFKKDPLFALSLLLAFHGLLRTGELLQVSRSHVSITQPKGPAVVSLGLTKSGKRTGAAESVSIHDEDVCRRLFQWCKTP